MGGKIVGLLSIRGDAINIDMRHELSLGVFCNRVCCALISIFYTPVVNVVLQ